MKDIALELNAFKREEKPGSPAVDDFTGWLLVYLQTTSHEMCSFFFSDSDFALMQVMISLVGVCCVLSL